MSKKSDRDKATTAMELSRHIGATVLAGLGPETQGAVLADLLAIWLSGFPRQAREEMLQAHLAGMRPLIEMNERIRFGEAGHPQNA
jgi:hypothetical protein